MRERGRSSSSSSNKLTSTQAPPNVLISSVPTSGDVPDLDHPQDPSPDPTEGMDSLGMGQFILPFGSPSSAHNPLSQTAPEDLASHLSLSPVVQTCLSPRQHPTCQSPYPGVLSCPLSIPRKLCPCSVFSDPKKVQEMPLEGPRTLGNPGPLLPDPTSLTLRAATPLCRAQPWHHCFPHSFQSLCHADVPVAVVSDGTLGEEPKKHSKGHQPRARLSVAVLPGGSCCLCQLWELEMTSAPECKHSSLPPPSPPGLSSYSSTKPPVLCIRSPLLCSLTSRFPGRMHPGGWE